ARAPRGAVRRRRPDRPQGGDGDRRRVPRARHRSVPRRVGAARCAPRAGPQTIAGARRIVVKKLLAFRSTLGLGGADRVTISVLRHLDRSRFAPTLVLVRAQGQLIDQVPPDVPVIDLRARRLALSIPALVRAIREVRPDVIFSTSGGGNSIAVIAR